MSGQIVQISSFVFLKCPDTMSSFLQLGNPQIQANKLHELFISLSMLFLMVLREEC